ncbi:armadillo segment polarity protein-like [Chenopodium quinoa]|uniref:armadillo segment polarity protein-like n=1 Tax=Chenopodium quinoa TaxID=63459 RepID=UPI000B790A9B|nr:armadillo segment polarity protein-like [Chenopodium quinoa]
MKEASPESDDLLLLSTHLLTSLLSTHLPLIHHFKPKWSLIKSKLLSLQSHLADFSDSHSHSLSSNSLSLSVLSSLSSALNDAVSLAGKCSDPSSLPAGKLRTQSDIDSLSSTLDGINKDCEILLRSGVLTQDAVVSSSQQLQGREAVRAEVRNLLTRLQIGSSVSKNSAMDSLLALLNEDDKNVLIGVAQGIVPVLVRSLDTTSFEMREKIVAAIARVSTIESSKHVLIAEGLSLLNQLIRVIESGSGFAKEKACVALQALSFSKENARAIGSRGGISSLLEICHCGTPSSQAMAAGVLRNLAQFEEIKENFVEENSIPVLIALSAAGTSLARENSIGCLSNLVCNDETLKVLVAREGGVESLKNYWDSTPIGRGLEPAVELLRNLASYHPIGEVLIFQGFPLRLLPLLNCGVLAVRIAAAGAVFELGFCSKARREMGENGCVSALVRMLDGKAIEEKEAAAKALSSLLMCTVNRKIFRKEERGIVGTVQLLDPLTKVLDKKWPIAVLTTLIHSKKCRKQMVAAGACVYLQKLVELEIEGAKKLLDCLGRGKLWGVFARP